jgi:large subunit ribosomal protein L13e
MLTCFQPVRTADGFLTTTSHIDLYRMVKHNNIIPNGHFHKQWQENVRTWFNQPGRKLRRRQARVQKAKAIFPRPVDGKLRPVVHAQTARYNMKVRLGRGFTLQELKV